MPKGDSKCSFKLLQVTFAKTFHLSSIRNQVYNQNFHLNASQFRRWLFFFVFFFKECDCKFFFFCWGFFCVFVLRFSSVELRCLTVWCSILNKPTVVAVEREMGKLDGWFGLWRRGGVVFRFLRKGLNMEVTAMHT